MYKNVLIGSFLTCNLFFLGLILAGNPDYEWVAFLLILNIILFFLLNSHFVNLGNKLNEIVDQKNKGESFNALKQYLTRNKELFAQVKDAIVNIKEIGQQNYYTIIEKINDEKIKNDLIDAHFQIKDLKRKEEENIWVTKGVAGINDLKQNRDNLSEYTSQLLKFIITYLKANQGAFFIRKEYEGEQCLEMVASYAYGKRKFLKVRVQEGEGLLGQIFFDKEIIYMTEVPKDYVNISSGLGHALPRCVCVIPLITDNKIYGAIELASFEVFKPYHQEFLNKISESIAYNLSKFHNTQRLLEESQNLTSELKHQENELRIKMEELYKAQDEMKKKQYELDTVLSSLSTVELDIEGNIVDANLIFLSVTGYSLNDLKEKSYKCLIPNSPNDHTQYDVMWSNIKEGRSFSGEFRIINSEMNEIWITGNFTPILNSFGIPEKIMVISIFTTQDKEKLIELQETMSALKSCFPFAEINPDYTFKSANELFLKEVGIRRANLRKTIPEEILSIESFSLIKRHYENEVMELPIDFVLKVKNHEGDVKEFLSTFVTAHSERLHSKRGFLILKQAKEHEIQTQYN
jgi:PAS domain S-box-containing protein